MDRLLLITVLSRMATFAFLMPNTSSITTAARQPLSEARAAAQGDTVAIFSVCCRQGLCLAYRGNLESDQISMLHREDPSR
jgi:hypothetical protein